MKKILTLMVAMVANTALAEQLELQLGCTVFIAIYDGEVPSDPRTIGYVEGYLTGVTSTANTTEAVAYGRLKDACFTDPTQTMRMAILAADLG